MKRMSRDYSETFGLWHTGFQGIEIMDMPLYTSYDIYWHPYIEGVLSGGNIVLLKDIIARETDRTVLHGIAADILSRPYNPETYALIFNELGLEFRNFTYSDLTDNVINLGDPNMIEHLKGDGVRFGEIKKFDLVLIFSGRIGVALLELMQRIFSFLNMFNAWIKKFALDIARSSSDAQLIDYLVSNDHITYNKYLWSLRQEKSRILPSLIRRAVAGGATFLPALVEELKVRYPDLEHLID